MDPRLHDDCITLIRSPDLVLISNTPKGRGVFAARDIPGSTVLDVCPVLVLSAEENEDHIKKTSLYHYTYNWPLPVTDCNNRNTITIETRQAVIFGLGSLFNHSSRHQNVGWQRDLDQLLITYRTLRDIKAGEELCISYGDRLTFDDVGTASGDDDSSGASDRSADGNGLDNLARIQPDL
ncbi:hypothetical protein BDY21DRAFT_332042 [Lineolata rhizophorae]|uniref:SET domain-containing protein n=1 Tax=Lineolata rhizophorae TaxID=578093 RepID=A0A6A6PC00_9PEZI|nr:hypothetical protein BDY21DRAFT_332042 [Lineolata rhizophorae]